jgi:hypothetical protein
MFVDTTNQIFLTRLHEEYEKVCQDCLEQVDSIKVSVSIHSSFYFFFRLFFQSNLNLNDNTEILLKVALNTITLTICIGILHKENIRKIKNSLILKKLIKR